MLREEACVVVVVERKRTFIVSTYNLLEKALPLSKSFNAKLKNFRPRRSK
jgi:hypothetical protein|tara:strand:- start:382 stop:531 length:150 start_codon:yes stop_codon:yes gene_type:complete